MPLQNMATNSAKAYKIPLNLLLGALIIILLLASFLFYQYFYKTQVVQVTPEIASTIATGLDLSSLDQTGHLNYRFLASHVARYDSEQRTDFQAPIGYFYQPNQPYWQLTADQGIALKDNEIVNLVGNVRIHQDAGKTNSAVTLTTSQMTVYPNQKIAFNNVLTTVSEPGITVTSIGFHADLNKNEIKLLSKASGQYDQSTSNKN